MANQQKPLNIVRLDGIHLPKPEFSIPHTYTEYHTTTIDEVTPRIKDADIVITTNAKIGNESLDPNVTPNLKMVAVMAAGTDLVDLKFCQSRGIPVSNVPAGSNESVAQHAFAMFLALRRRLGLLHQRVLENEMWPERGTCVAEFGGVPGGWSEEVVGIIGGGNLGERIASIVEALGMKALKAERKGIEESATRPGRTSFTETLRLSTVIMMTCPLTEETRGMIDTPEFSLMKPEALLVNVARGPLVVESALVEALKSSQIAGAATDVFTAEPATRENSVLVREAPNLKNLILTPHVAWYCRSSMNKVCQIVSENIEAFWEGRPQNIVNGV